DRSEPVFVGGRAVLQERQGVAVAQGRVADPRERTAEPFVALVVQRTRLWWLDLASHLDWETFSTIHKGDYSLNGLFKTTDALYGISKRSKGWVKIVRNWVDGEDL